MPAPLPYAHAPRPPRPSPAHCVPTRPHARRLASVEYGARNRLATLFWYVSSVQEGGETFFPRALNASGHEYMPWNGDHEDCYRGLAVKPTKGNAVLFYSLLPNGHLDERSLHGGCKPRGDDDVVKWGANQCARARARRAPERAMPRLSAATPPVWPATTPRGPSAPARARASRDPLPPVPPRAVPRCERNLERLQMDLCARGAAARGPGRAALAPATASNGRCLTGAPTARRLLTRAACRSREQAVEQIHVRQDLSAQGHAKRAAKRRPAGLRGREPTLRNVGVGRPVRVQSAVHAGVLQSVVRCLLSDGPRRGP